MSDRLTIISRLGRVFEIVNSWQVLLVRRAPTKIAVDRLESRWQGVPYHLSYKTVLATFTAHG
ncbi:hypothetical protein, partial [Microcoleus sp. B13-B6]|uniref:hypothetical protein n=1 Tax=Microcoleus sp. B13-B6 TaxID=2818652 RepID=UPI002FCFC5F9